MATQTAGTVNDVLQIIADLRGESSVDSSAMRIRAVSRSERDYALRKYWRTHRLESTTTGDGSASDFTIGSASYPMRIKGLTEVFVGGTTEDKRHQIVDFNKYKNLYNRDNSTKMAYEWYDAANDAWKVHINPVPANGDTIYYTYFWEPPTRTATSDAVVCPNLKIIAKLALGYIYEGEDEDQKAILAKQDAEQMILELDGMEVMPAQNQIYTVGAIENSVQDQGFGTY